MESLAGLVCAAEIVLETGEVASRFGDAERVDARSAKLCERARAMRDAGGDLDDVIFTTLDRVHLFVFDETRSRVLYAESERATGNIAMTRFALEALAAS
jgi:hypothetical protein